MTPARSRIRFPLMGVAVLTLLLASWAGLIRLGWNWPIPNAKWVAAHGPLMVAGFLGILIGVERALALGKRWMYGSPFLAGLGGVILLAGFPEGAKTLIVLGSLWFVAVFGVILRRHFALYTAVMTLGAVTWLVGNVLWLAGWPVSRVVLWWGGFLILTITGERLELGRLVQMSRRVQQAFVGAASLFLLGLVLSLVSSDWGTRLAGLGMLALAGWLLRNDIAWRTIRKQGLTRFIAICMLTGYVWLGVGGLMGMVFGSVSSGVRYDAFLHTIFLGFVFVMIFGHAPIVFPAILGSPIHFTPRFYLHLGALHLSLLLRVVGDLIASFPLRRWGGLLNGVAILIFLANMVISVRKSRQ